MVLNNQEIVEKHLDMLSGYFEEMFSYKHRPKKKHQALVPHDKNELQLIYPSANLEMNHYRLQ